MRFGRELVELVRIIPFIPFSCKAHDLNMFNIGVVALIRGNEPGKCCALRADMDALPIVEAADVPYKSVNHGVMHACGHDGHMTSLLATAKVLQGNRHHFKGVVKLIFQPAEEGYSGGL